MTHTGREIDEGAYQKPVKTTACKRLIPNPAYERRQVFRKHMILSACIDKAEQKWR